MIINDFGYELNAVNVSDVHVEFESDPYGINYTSNGITHQKLLGSRTIGVQHEEVSVFTPLTNPRIDENNKPYLLISTGAVQAPQALKYPVVQEIVADTASKNTGENRTLRRVSRTGIEVNNPVPNGISGTYTPYPIGILVTSASPPSGGL